MFPPSRRPDEGGLAHAPSWMKVATDHPGDYPVYGDGRDRCTGHSRVVAPDGKGPGTIGNPLTGSRPVHPTERSRACIPSAPGREGEGDRGQHSPPEIAGWALTKKQKNEKESVRPHAGARGNGLSPLPLFVQSATRGSPKHAICAY
jgi:hypothetical protein